MNKLNGITTEQGTSQQRKKAGTQDLRQLVYGNFYK